MGEAAAPEALPELDFAPQFVEQIWQGRKVRRRRGRC